MSSEFKKLALGALLAIALGLFFRAASDLRDGLSLRQPAVGWYSWHVLGWLSRDLYQAMIAIAVSIKALLSAGVIGRKAVLYIAGNLAASAALAFLWHDFLYGWAFDHIEYFWW